MRLLPDGRQPAQLIEVGVRIVLNGSVPKEVRLLQTVHLRATPLEGILVRYLSPHAAGPPYTWDSAASKYRCLWSWRPSLAAPIISCHCTGTNIGRARE